MGDDQRKQIIKIDKDLSVTKGHLLETKGMLKAMKSWRGFIKRKFKKDDTSHLQQENECAVPKKSVFHRNKKKRFMQKMNKDRNKKIAPISPKNEVDRRQSQKLDEIHQGIKKMNETIPQIKQQNYTMKKICH